MNFFMHEKTVVNLELDRFTRSLCVCGGGGGGGVGVGGLLLPEVDAVLRFFFLFFFLFVFLLLFFLFFFFCSLAKVVALRMAKPPLYFRNSECNRVERK